MDFFKVGIVLIFKTKTKTKTFSDFFFWIQFYWYLIYTYWVNHFKCTVWWLWINVCLYNPHNHHHNQDKGVFITQSSLEFPFIECRSPNALAPPPNPLHGSKQALIWFLTLQISLFQNSFKWNHTVWTKMYLASVLFCFSFSAWFWNLSILLHVSVVYFFLLMSIPLYVYVVVLWVHAQSCPTLCDPLDWSQKASSVHGFLQARILEWVAISFSRGSSQPRDQILSLASPALAGGFPPHHLGRLYMYIPLFVYEFIGWHTVVDSLLSY